MTPVTISGAVVDVEHVIDALVAQIAEQALTIASLRAQVASWSALAHAQVRDGVPDPAEPPESAESPPEPSRTASGVPYWFNPEMADLLRG